MFRFTNHEWTGDILDHLMAKKLILNLDKVSHDIILLRESQICAQFEREVVP
jgi:hypothetical protein